MTAFLRQIERAGLPAPTRGRPLCPTATYLEVKRLIGLPDAPALDLAWEERAVGVLFVPGEAQTRGRSRRSAARVSVQRLQRRAVGVEALLEGWEVVLVTPQAIEDGSALGAVRSVLGGGSPAADTASIC